MKRNLGLLILGSLFSLLVSYGEASSQEFKLIAPDASAFDRFGQAVAICEDYLVVGAHREDTGGSSAGAVYVYSRSDSSYLRTLLASDAGANHFFGSSLAAEGNQVLIGAPGNGSGSAYLFDLTTGQELKKFLPSAPTNGDQFGQAVALSSTHVLVGAWQEDNDALNPSEDSGAAYLFSRSTFAELHRLQANDIAPADQFGGSVALTSSHACIGSSFDDHSGEADAGSVYLFDVTTGNELQKLTAPNPTEGDVFGASLSAKGNLLVVGAPEADAQGESSGAAFLFQISNGSWLADLLPAGGSTLHRIGNAVAIDNQIVVGAFRSPVNSLNDAGAVHVFNTNGTYQNTLTASDGNTADFMGHSVATRDNLALAGAIQDDDGGPSSGSAYLFSTAVPALLENLTIQVSANNVILQWQATPNANYAIYTTTDISTWPPSPTFTHTPSNANAQFIDLGGALAGKKFYRVVVD